MQAISHGRYMPPCKKTARDQLCQLSASIQQSVIYDIKKHVYEDMLDISISGRLEIDVIIIVYMY